MPTQLALTYVLVNRLTGRIASREMSYREARALLRQMPRNLYSIEPMPI